MGVLLLDPIVSSAPDITAGLRFLVFGKSIIILEIIGYVYSSTCAAAQ